MHIKLISFILVVLTITSKAQDNNTVLWKISGNGLQKPSYIFGTIHLTDKRVFYANDSLIEFISQCDYFANELHPDSLNAFMFGMMTKNDTNDVYRNIFSNDDYRLVNKKLEDDFGLNLKQLKKRNLRTLRMLLNPQKKSSDDYPTFLDGYLLGIAKRKGKTIIGLEGIESHEKAISSEDEEEMYKKDILEIGKNKKVKSDYDVLIKNYLNGDLASIDKNYSYYSFDLVYNLLARRNFEMAKTIDSILKKNTLFATFGAAHLAGSSGIIEILENKGYTVSPVLSKKKSYLSVQGLPENFSTWKTISDPSLGITYQLPGIPGNSIKEVLLSDFKMYIDISSGISYAILPLASAIQTNNKDEIFDKFANAFQAKTFGGKTILNAPIRFKEFDGRDIEVESFDGISKVRVFFENNIVYILSVNYKKNNECKSEVEHFFNTAEFYKPIAQNAFHFKKEKWAMEMDFPAKPNEKGNVNKYGGTREESISLRASDNVNGIHYVLEAMEIGPGRFIPNDSVVLESIKDFLENNEKAVEITDTSYLIPGGKCLQVEGLFNDSSFILSRNYIRGYRVYSLSVVMSAETKRKHIHDAFANSFNFLELNNSTFKAFPFPEDSALTILLPQAPYKETIDTTEYNYYDTEEEVKYLSFDKQTCFTYYARKVDKGPYFYTQPDSVVWKDFDKTIVGYNDTLIETKSYSSKNLKGRQVVLRSKSTNSLTKLLRLDLGKYYVDVYYYYPSVLVYPQQDFPFQNVSYSGIITSEIISDTSACRKLINDLASTDSTTRKKAESELNYFKFTDKMQSIVLSTLKSGFIKDDTSDYIDVNKNLIRELKTFSDTTQ